MNDRIKFVILFIILAIFLLACNFLQPSSSEMFENIVTTLKAGVTSTPENVPSLTLTPSVQSTTVIETVLPTVQFEDGALALQYLTELTRIGSRAMKAQTHQKAEEYIRSTLTEMGYSPEIQSFKTKKGFNAMNITARKPGKSDRMIIAGGHFDMAAVGAGVDDNGSGVAVLLEAARRLKNMDTPYTIEFVFFDAEESGMEGSNYYVSKMTDDDVKNTVAMINLDSLAVGDYTYIYGDQGDDGVIRDWALNYAANIGYTLITQPGKNPDYPAGTTVDASDHAPFLHRGIQYVYFEATNWDLGELDGYTQVNTRLGEKGEIWHTRFDTLEYIRKTFPGRMEDHLKLFSNVLMHILTDYSDPAESTP
jgi:alkaline phosphatase isozyme conversion protein